MSEHVIASRATECKLINEGDAIQASKTGIPQRIVTTKYSIAPCGMTWT